MENKKIVVIDADSLIYLAGYSVKDSRNEALGIAAINDHIFRILKDTKATHYIAFYQEQSYNFRYDIYPQYKANRKGKTEEWSEFWKPIFKKVMKEQWGFVNATQYHIESDDAMQIAFTSLSKQYDAEKEVVMAYIDKDLNTIQSDSADAHIWFNYKTKAWYRVRKERSIYFLWAQIITGDSGDNIKGIPGKGPAFAKKLLEHIQTYPRRMFFAVYREYIKKFPITYRKEYILNRDCLQLKDAAKGFITPEPAPVPDLMEKLNVELLNI